MADTVSDHENHGTEPVTDHVHSSAWIADLERPEHAADRELLVEEGITAVENTVGGSFVQLVTYEAYGHPSEYLHEPPEETFGDSVHWEYVCQCNRGGHIVRVEV
ncbi:CGCGG family rSAM-modified RiPP protein [Saliphagus infecundisoli]|nr:CGCGG family rSAM-modified RiPP protein [Saliphagus infecundisoli]